MDKNLRETPVMDAHIVPPIQDALAEQFPDQVYIVDSPPPVVENERLAEFLRKRGFVVGTMYYKNPQADAECGYRAMNGAWKMCDPERFTEEENDIAHVIRFCNSVIGQDCRSQAVVLSDESIRRIMRCMCLLFDNFNTQPWNYKNANCIVDLLRKLDNALNDAICEAQTYKEPLIITVKLLFSIIDETAAYTKEGEFKSFLKWTKDQMRYAAVDYKSIKDKLNHLFNNAKPPDWFDGVYAMEDFALHMVNIQTVDQVDMPLVPLRSAIVNTHECPGQHWFIVAYKLASDQRRLAGITKAREG